MKIKTDVLKELTLKAVKGVGNNKLLPITTMITLCCMGDKLELITTDRTTDLVVSCGVESKDDFDFNVITVDADKFSKLVTRTTSEDVELTVKDGVMTYKGNGKYQLPIIIDENGDTVVITPFDYNKDKKAINIDSSCIADVITGLKQSLATTMETPVLTNYYLADGVIATDAIKLSMLDEKLTDKPLLISSKVMDLISLIDGDVSAYEDADKLVFTDKTESVAVYTHKIPGVEDYPIDGIRGLLDSAYPHSCAVNKSAVQEVLDRIALFVEPYDQYGVRLTFTNNDLSISSLKSNGVEVIKYDDPIDDVNYSCVVDVQMLSTLIRSIKEEVVVVHFGLDSSLKLEAGNLTQIVSLMEE